MFRFSEDQPDTHSLVLSKPSLNAQVGWLRRLEEHPLFETVFFLLDKALLNSENCASKIDHI